MARSKRAASALTAAVAITAPILLAACGSGSASPGSSSTGTAGAADAVMTAARTTAAAKGATLALAETVTGTPEPITFTLRGSGAVDFLEPAAKMSLSESISGEPIHESILTTAGRVYVSIAGQSKVTGGRAWTELPLNLSQAGATGSIGSGASAGQFIPLLEQSGEVARAVASAVVEGAQTTEYQVTMNRATYLAAERRSLAGAGLTPALLSQAEAAERGETVPLIRVWVDGSGDIRQIELQQTERVKQSCASGGGPCASERLAVVLYATLSDFGRTVDITAPPASQVVSYAAFLRDEEHSG